MTTQRDSETPSCHPFKNMMARTLMMMMATQRMERQAWMKFLVAANKTTKAKVIAIAIPEMADCTKAASEGIQAQTKPPVCARDWSYGGLLALVVATKPSHKSISGCFLLAGSVKSAYDLALNSTNTTFSLIIPIFFCYLANLPSLVVLVHLSRFVFKSFSSNGSFKFYLVR